MRKEGKGRGGRERGWREKGRDKGTKGMGGTGENMWWNREREGNGKGGRAEKGRRGAITPFPSPAELCRQRADRLEQFTSCSAST